MSSQLGLVSVLGGACYAEIVRMAAAQSKIGKRYAHWLHALRRWLIRRFKDPEVRMRVGRRILLMNLSHPRPLQLVVHKNYDRALPRICSNLCNPEIIKGKRAPFVVDVGANIGDSISMILDECRADFLAIEPDGRFLRQLSLNVKSMHSTVIIETSLCGDRDGVIRMALEPGCGTASVREGAGLPRSVRSVDSLIHANSIQNVDLIKIDTDGFELPILRGCERTLVEHRPALFFEFTPDAMIRNGHLPYEIFRFLHAAGYRVHVFYDNYGNPIGQFPVSEVVLERLINRIDCKSVYYYDVFSFHASRAAEFSGLIAAELSVDHQPHTSD
ncbi:MAG: FkbM family methyltransferase [Verrucomicrobia bacterium]|nr:FkbM family methyltransferase [Verrucomicrobiota bacterium]